MYVQVRNIPTQAVWKHLNNALSLVAGNAGWVEHSVNMHVSKSLITSAIMVEIIQMSNEGSSWI